MQRNVNAEIFTEFSFTVLAPISIRYPAGLEGKVLDIHINDSHGDHMPHHYP